MFQRTKKSIIATSLVAVAALAMSACGSSDSGSDTNSGGAFKPPSRVTALVHTGPGGGGDLLAREIIAMMEKEEIIKKGSWTVENREGANSAVALSYLNEQSGRDDLVAFASNIWFSNQLVTKGVNFNSLDFTPVYGLYNDAMLAVVSAKSPYKTLDDFTDAAKKAGGDLVQAGGNTTAVDALAGSALQKDSGAKWRYLPFPSGGERKTALLRGDAQITIAEPAEVMADIEAGDMRAIAAMGADRSMLLPDVETSVEQGYPTVSPAQFRGVLGPKKMSKDAIAYYSDLFDQLAKTKSWEEYITRLGATPRLQHADEYRASLTEQREAHIKFFTETDQLVQK